MGRDDDRRAAGSRRGGDRSDRPPAGRTAAEWTTLVVSLVVTAALVGVALYEHYGRKESPGTWARVDVRADGATRRGDLYYVPFTVVNVGGEAATDVNLVFTVKQGDTVLEESTAEIAFLPVEGSAEGELVTAHDPASHEIEGRVGTLQAP